MIKPAPLSRSARSQTIVAMLTQWSPMRSSHLGDSDA
jgi:hypothetical protein